MDRRTLLTLMLAASLTGCNAVRTRGSRLNVVVAGAGIVGASIAYHLARSGASVTVIDKAGPATNASRGTFAWVNATWAKQPREFHALNQEGVSGWATLQRDLGLALKWGGSLEWFDNAPRQQLLAAQVAEQVSWGERTLLLGGEELAALEPRVNFTGANNVSFSENDGAVDPVEATLALLRAAERMGATISYPCELQALTMEGSRLRAVQTSKGSIKADRLVLATGAEPEAARNFADTNLPQRSTPGVIVITKPMPALLNRIVSAPGVHMQQRIDGRVVLGEQDGPPANAAHAQRLKDRPNEFPTPAFAAMHAGRLLAVASRYLSGIEQAEIDKVHIGWRPLPLDGLPVLGASPNRPDVYLAVMHSGVSLAPIVGQLAAHELIAGAAVERLDSFRPGRQFESANTY